MNVEKQSGVNLKKSNAIRKTKALENKKKPKTVNKTFYESPLRHIRQSAKRYGLIHGQTNIKSDIHQLDKPEISPANAKVISSHQDSVIILSDNEHETTTEEPKNVKKKRKKKGNNAAANGSTEIGASTMEPLCTLEITNQQFSMCLRSASKALTSDSEPVPHNSKKRKRKCEIPSNNNTSCLVISDTEDNSQNTIIDVDGENIAPECSKQGSDDIEIVWSSKNPSSDKQAQKTHTQEQTLVKNSSLASNKPPQAPLQKKDAVNENNERLFMLDFTPNRNNLNCLRANDLSSWTVKLSQRERYEKDDNDLPFNKPGLQLPKPQIGTGFQMNYALNSTSQICYQRTNLFPTSMASHEDFQYFQNSNTRLREIVIDGNNVAMAHTNGKTFSEVGLKLVIDYFRVRGHSVKAFVPQYRRSLGHKLLEDMYTEGLVVFTPSRNIGGRRITPYDDRFILEYASVCKGIVVSSDQYRDLYREKPEWRDTITNRLLAPTFVGNYVMFPEDPLGRNGPRLEEFLRY